MRGLELLAVIHNCIRHLFYPHGQLAAVVRAIVPLIGEHHEGVVVFISNGSSHALRTLSVRKQA